MQRIEYRKGPYFAQSGDFASAGAADIVYVSKLDAPFGQLTLGQRGYRRGVAGTSFEIADGVTLLGALELMRNDGPWTLPENLKRTNAVLGLIGGTAARGWSTRLMGYDASWVSTDQVPQRLIDAGRFNGGPFGRFDAVDPSNGGKTSRSSLSAEWHAQGQAGRTRMAGYAMRYLLELDSNFTYALDKPVDGDQFKQTDRRSVYGLSASRSWSHGLAGWDARSDIGLQLRHDRIRVGLFDTVARRITATTRDDMVRETQVGVYGQTALQFTPALRAILGLRADQLHNRVDALIAARKRRQCARHAVLTQAEPGRRPFRQDRVLRQRRPRHAQQRRARHHHQPRPQGRRPDRPGAATGVLARLRDRCAH